VTGRIEHRIDESLHHVRMLIDHLCGHDTDFQWQWRHAVGQGGQHVDALLLLDANPLTSRQQRRIDLIGDDGARARGGAADGDPVHRALGQPFFVEPQSGIGLRDRAHLRDGPFLSSEIFGLGNRFARDNDVGVVGVDAVHRPCRRTMRDRAG
jgi:hypothetical protein